MWVAMEATTLATAPLHLFQPQRRVAGGDLEISAHRLGRHRPGAARLVLPRVCVAARPAGIDAAVRRALGQAPRLSTPWLHAAFVLLFIGYGTKMGLAPMHTWKPDAYGEAPGVVGTFWPAASQAARSWRSCGFIRSAGPRARAEFARGDS